jgi:DNA-binding response OmpR family regulator
MPIDELKAKWAGCDDYITKPVDVHALSDVVAAHLDAQRAAPAAVASAR